MQVKNLIEIESFFLLSFQFEFVDKLGLLLIRLDLDEISSVESHAGKVPILQVKLHLTHPSEPELAFSVEKLGVRIITSVYMFK